jgi:hypothetical protein
MNMKLRVGFNRHHYTKSNWADLKEKCLTGSRITRMVRRPPAPSPNAQFPQQALQVKIEPADGSYTFDASGSADPALHGGVVVDMDGTWLKSKDHCSQTVKELLATDDLGDAQRWSVTFSELGVSRIFCIACAPMLIDPSRTSRYSLPTVRVNRC